MVKSRSFIATPPGATIKEQLIDRGPVSYTHLDVYKRQEQRRTRL